jgi:hypothetical protein
MDMRFKNKIGTGRVFSLGHISYILIAYWRNTVYVFENALLS